MRNPSLPTLGSLLTMVLALTACGGGGGGSGGEIAVVPASGPTTGSSGSSAVVVTVTDFLGAPVPDAPVRLHDLSTGRVVDTHTDANGVASVTKLAAGRWAVSANAPWPAGSTTSHMRAYMPDVTLPDGAALPVTLAMEPATDTVVGIGRSRINDGGLSADGRTLEFTLQVLHVGAGAYQYAGFGPAAMVVVPCTPNPSDDLGSVGSDCVAGKDGYDVGYANWIPADYDPARGNPWGRAVSIETLPRPAGADPLAGFQISAALLIDQSDSVTTADLEDMRLIAAKYFMKRMTVIDRAVLAGFAADDDHSGRPALLPQKPVTIFPVEQPRFATGVRDSFATIDGLASLEGGASSLYAAIDRMLDFTAAEAPAASTRALVVLSDGQDATCGTPADCRLRREALIRKSRDTGIAMVMVGVAGVGTDVAREALGTLAQGAPGSAVFWTDDPRELPNALGAVSQYLRGLRLSYDATFRVVATEDGAFAPGRTVFGTVQLEECPWDCFYLQVPFVVTIP